MAHIRVVNGVVVQKSNRAREGFIEAPDDVVCGMVTDGVGGWAAPPHPSWSPDKLLKVVKTGREIALNRLAGIAFAAREANDPATVTACLAARQSLLDITKLPAVLAATDDASLTAAIGAGYAAIVGACPVNIKSAFAGIQT